MPTAVPAATVTEDGPVMPLVPVEGHKLAKGGNRLDAHDGGLRSVRTCVRGVAASLSSGRSSVGLGTSWKVPAAA